MTHSVSMESVEELAVVFDCHPETFLRRKDGMHQLSTTASFSRVVTHFRNLVVEHAARMLVRLRESTPAACSTPTLTTASDRATPGLRTSVLLWTYRWKAKTVGSLNPEGLNYGLGVFAYRVCL